MAQATEQRLQWLQWPQWHSQPASAHKEGAFGAGALCERQGCVGGRVLGHDH